jgi:phytoene dehydrogenase-like protein
MWEQMTARIEEMGGEVRMSTPVERIELEGRRVARIHAGGESSSRAT